MCLGASVEMCQVNILFLFICLFTDLKAILNALFYPVLIMDDSSEDLNFHEQGSELNQKWQ